MKFNLDKRYMKICKYIIMTAVLIYISIKLINMVPFLYDNVMATISSILDMLYPVIIGLSIAYLLYGPASALERFLINRKHLKIKSRKICRAISIAVSYIVVIGIIVGIICSIYFMIGGQISKSTTITNIAESISDYIQNNSLSTESLKELIDNSKLPFAEAISSQVDSIANTIQDVLSSLAGSMADTIFTIGGNIISITLGLILSIYLLFSREYFQSIWKRFYFLLFRNSKIGSSVRRSFAIINFTFSKYIRGQLIEAFIVGVLSTIALLIVGIDYAVVIGIIAGITNLIPYIGPLIGTVLAGLMALFSGDVWQAVWAVVAMQIVQQIDGNILSPKIVGDIVGLNPAFIIIAIIVGGDLGGLLGMLIAVPIAASLKTIISEWYSSRFEKAYNDSPVSHDIDKEKLNNTIKKHSTKKAKKAFDEDGYQYEDTLFKTPSAKTEETVVEKNDSNKNEQNKPTN